MTYWLPITMIMVLIGSFIGSYVGRQMAIRTIEKAERRVNRNSNALRMGLLETYQARQKVYISFQDSEELYHIMRNYF